MSKEDLFGSYQVEGIGHVRLPCLNILESDYLNSQLRVPYRTVVITTPLMSWPWPLHNYLAVAMDICNEAIFIDASGKKKNALKSQDTFSSVYCPNLFKKGLPYWLTGIIWSVFGYDFNTTQGMTVTCAIQPVAKRA